jgi:isopentenyl-diphosphate delta-isomerase
MASEPSSISQRKADHIEVAASGAADFQSSTLLECVELQHCCLPELSTDDLDLSVPLLGKTLSLPLVITGMTGGTEEAQQINRDLAEVAEQSGIAFGVGSQRAMAEQPELAHTYAVRDVAPTALILGNIGAVQALNYGPERVAALAEAIGADAMAVHLNPAQELIQEAGDRDFRGIVEGLAALKQTLDVPLVVKETGCGISRACARTLVDIGAAAIDISGAGGTSWVAVEAQRATDKSAAASLGHELWNWGIPTAVATASVATLPVDVIASGGLRSGLDVAKVLALGATAAGMAAPILRAQRRGGVDAALAAVHQIRRTLEAVCLLCGCKTPAELARAPRYIAEPLRSYLKDVQE